MSSIAISGNETAKIIRSVFLQQSAIVSITRPKPLPATTFSAAAQAQQMGAHKADQYRREGLLNTDAPLPVLFLFLPGTDIKAGDQITYQSATYKVLSVQSQDSPDGVSQFLEAPANQI